MPQSYHSGLQPAGTILRQTCGDLIVSKQKLKQAERIELVRQNREQATQTLCFSSRPFVLCGLPVRRLPKDQLLYERRNGKFVLQVTGHPEFGVPFGQDRLVPIFLATLAVQQKSQTIRFRTAAEMLETFGMQTGGKEYRRLVEAFERVLAQQSSSERMRLKARPRWFSDPGSISCVRPRSGTAAPQSSARSNVIVLSDDFYQEVLAHPVPNDLEAVKLLAAAPAVLDLYMWLSYRCFAARGSEQIPIFGDFGLASQLGCVEYSRPRRFRAMLEQWLGTIRVAWPNCPAAISKDGQSLVIRNGTAVLSTMQPNGVAGTGYPDRR